MRHFSSKQADASGQLSVTIQGSGGLVASGSDLTGGIVNGFQITPVPEPAAMTLFAVGGLGVLTVSCRRRKL